MWYLKYGAVSLIMIGPAYVINLLVVGLMVTFQIHLIWILSSVVVGDIIGWFINQNLSIYLQIHWKLLHRIQDESKEFLRGR